MTGFACRALGMLLVFAVPAAGCADGTAPTGPEAAASCDDEVLRAAGRDAVFALLETPSAGAQVGARFRAAGCANVPEGTVGWRIRDARGAELARGSTTASCGSGCVGSLAFDVALDDPPKATAVTLEVFTVSMRDGTQTTLAAVPFLVTGAEQAASEAAPLGASACSDPVFREEGADLAFIFPIGPPPGARLESGFPASGCANVFEANVSWRLRSAVRGVLAEGFATATCGTGCVGSFAFDVPYAPPEAAPELAALEMYSVSARDGSEDLLVTIPILLE